MPRDVDDPEKLRTIDWLGLVYAWLGFGLLFAAIDQGNRLDWFGSGTVAGLAVAGSVALAAFVARELTSTRPVLDLRLLVHPGLIVLFLLLAGYRFIILSTAYIIPNYLQMVQNYRGLDVGAVLLWIALPQFALVVPLAFLLTRIDPRWTLGIGSALIGVACLVATGLTSAWTTADFLPSQVLQAVGQSLALTSLVVLVATTIKPEQAVTIGAFMQTSRLFGGEVGVAFMQTFVRVREQLHSNLLDLHVQAQVGVTLDRLLAYTSAVGTHLADAGAATAQATVLLANTVGRQAYVLAYIDGFQAAAAAAALCWLLAMFVPRPLRS